MDVEASSVGGGADAQPRSKAKLLDFYNDAVNDELFAPQNRPYMAQAYRAWKKDQKTERERAARSAGAAEELDKHWLPESVISYPFVLSAATKARILQVDAQQQMHEVRACCEVYSLHQWSIPVVHIGDLHRWSTLAVHTECQQTHDPHSNQYWMVNGRARLRRGR